MRLFPGKAAGDASGIPAGAFPLDSLPPKDKIQVFVAAPSKARLRFYTPGLHWRLEKLFPLREGGNAEEDVPRAKFPLTKPGFCWEKLPERTHEESKEQRGVFSGLGFFPQNPTNNEMWMNPLGKTGRGKDAWHLGAEFQQQREGSAGSRGDSDSQEISQIPASPWNVWLIRASLRGTSHAEGLFWDLQMSSGKLQG